MARDEPRAGRWPATAGKEGDGRSRYEEAQSREVKLASFGLASGETSRCLDVGAPDAAKVAARAEQRLAEHDGLHAWRQGDDASPRQSKRA
jgi:hypothetical protein